MKSRKFIDLSEDSGVPDGVISSTKKLRIASSDIDNVWKSVPTTPRIDEGQGSNSELHNINGLLKELHHYRQARRSSAAINACAAKLAETNRMSCSPEPLRPINTAAAVAVADTGSGSGSSGCATSSDSGFKSLTASIASYDYTSASDPSARDENSMDSSF
jgi:hypothetical protein